MNWGDTVAYWARWQGDAIAIRFGDYDVTWAQLDARASSLAASLSDLGVGHRDRVGLLMSNRPEFVEVVVACARLGAIVAPFNLRFTAPELAFVVGNADCTVVVSEHRLLDGLAIARQDRPQLIVLDVDEASWEDRCSSRREPPPAQVADDDPFFICYTSGTTGDPKGAVLTHRS